MLGRKLAELSKYIPDPHFTIHMIIIGVHTWFISPHNKIFMTEVKEVLQLAIANKKLIRQRMIKLVTHDGTKYHISSLSTYLQPAA